eukprot:677660-Prymnesium_polylepis.1
MVTDATAAEEKGEANVHEAARVMAAATHAEAAGGPDPSNLQERIDNTREKAARSASVLTGFAVPGRAPQKQIEAIAPPTITVQPGGGAQAVSEAPEAAARRAIAATKAT